MSWTEEEREAMEAAQAELDRNREASAGGPRAVAVVAAGVMPELATGDGQSESESGGIASQGESKA